jgi:hypothetical protein
VGAISPRVSEAIQNLEQSPDDPDTQKILELQIKQAATRGASFRDELLKRLADLAPTQTATQNAIATGGSSVVQVNAGRDAKVIS